MNQKTITGCSSGHLTQAPEYQPWGRQVSPGLSAAHGWPCGCKGVYRLYFITWDFRLVLVVRPHGKDFPLEYTVLSRSALMQLMPSSILWEDRNPTCPVHVMPQTQLLQRDGAIVEVLMNFTCTWCVIIWKSFLQSPHKKCQSPKTGSVRGVSQNFLQCLCLY